MIKNLIENYAGAKPHRNKSRILKLVMQILPLQSLRSYYGPILCCNPNDRTNVYALSGDYGHIISSHILSLPTDSVFIDIGANYGLFSLLAGSHLTKGKVFAFEPNPEIYKFFITAQKLNKLKNVISFNCAIGREDGSMVLSYNKCHSGASRLISADQKNSNDDLQSVKVEVLNIADCNQLSELKNSSEVHIKIDVEGYEAVIIEVLKRTPWYGNVKSIVVEIDEEHLKQFNSCAEMLYESLEKDGFKPKFGLDQNRHYDEIFSR